LEINLTLNKVANCQAMNIAASDKAGPIEFLLSRANSGGSKRVPAVKEFIYYYDNPQTIAVEGFRLDDRLTEKAFDLIVMDIEGSEYFALQGMQKILRASKVLAVEFLPHHLKNVSRVTVADFVALIEPHFSLMTIPSQRREVPRADFGFRRALQEMYDADQGDAGLVFEKRDAAEDVGARGR
jgi:FkbM family methyltransferase